MRLFVKSINMALTLGFLAAAVFLVYVAVPYFGNKALIVRSGSMQPAIGVGDLVVVKGADRIVTPAPGTFPKYKVGDVVAFSGEKDAKTITTHRVVNIDAKDGKIAYTTKGDANNAPDGNLVAEGRILGKTTIKIPALGKIFAMAKTRNGFLALVVLPAILVIIFEFFNIFREIGKIRQKKVESGTWAGEEGQNNPNNILLRLLVPIVIGTMFFEGSFASYADTETSSGNSMQAADSYQVQTEPSPSPNGIQSTDLAPSVDQTLPAEPSPTPAPSPTPEVEPSPITQILEVDHSDPA